jgi:hypothetical protein
MTYKIQAMKASLLFTISIFFLMFSCSKGEGPGGKASISGTVTKQEYTFPDVEVNEITCNNNSGGWGLPSEPSYFILNTPAGMGDYYVWFYVDGSGANPNLTGRTGIQVNINSTDDNIVVATKTKDALVAGAAVDFYIQQYDDLLVVTNRDTGDVVDIEDWDMPFAFNRKQQGRDGSAGPTESGADERVYIKYGDSEIYNDDFRTDIDGTFKFGGLKKGQYLIYMASYDEASGQPITETRAVTISSSTEEVVVDDFNILY